MTISQSKDLEAVLEVSRAMMMEKYLDRLLALIVSKATEVLEAERSSIFLVDNDTQELWSRVAQAAEISEIRFPWDKGIAGSVVQNRQLINITDAYQDSRFNPAIDKRTGYRTRTILCAPLINHKNEVTGALQVLNKKDGVFNEHDESLITAFSAQAAVAIENAQLYQEQEYTFRQFLKTITATLDARDPVTAGHSERVTRYALNLGKAIGFSPEELKTLEYAALLHDVGKIAVRDDVLLKPGKLTPEEFAKMKSHAVKTKEILENMFIGREVREIPHIASAHHEKIDGSGYPFGLKGEQISRAAKILGIVDVFDALVAEDRPYKKAMSLEQALSILEQDKGTKFDAELVDLFKNKQLYNIERRKTPRYALEIPLVYQPHTDKKIVSTFIMPAKTINLSTEGLLLEGKRLLPVGTLLDLLLKPPQKELKSTAKVVRAEKRYQIGEYHIGIQFVNLLPEAKQQLAELFHP